MRQEHRIICLCLLFLSKYSVESTTTVIPPAVDWPGDPAICTINDASTTTTTSTSTSSPIPPILPFSTQAEFGTETITTRYNMSILIAHDLILSHFVYDYDNNRLVAVDNRNGNYDRRFYDYSLLRESIYYGYGQHCDAKEIPQNDPTNGQSAIDLGNANWHIRRLNEFLLFSSDDSSRPVPIVYLGTNTIRGIPVDTWQSCHVNPTLRRTEKVVWSFAQRGVSMPNGVVRDYSIPVQAVMNASIVRDDNFQLNKTDAVINVLFFRPSLIKSFYQITPSRAVMCNGVRQDQLISLANASVSWPTRFDVRIEISTSHSSQWQRVHLFYQRGETDMTSRLRYDYQPAGAGDFKSMIHDYTDNITYNMNRHLGTCQITRGVEYKDIDPFGDPIGFFLKHEDMFILNPPENAWEAKGFRPCRTGSMQCAIFTTTKPNFPDIIEPDTGAPTGETYAFTTIEYLWSKRAPHAGEHFNLTRPYDYPVSLYLKLNRNDRTETIEYEFYEMSHDNTINRFDVGTCYRSLNYDYLHLVFNLKLDRGEIIDDSQLDRSDFERTLHYHLVNRMQIRYSRLTDLEIDHEFVSNNVTVFFTLLGQTPKPESASGVDDRETTVAQAHEDLNDAINNEKFTFEIRLRNRTRVDFRAVANSLQASKQFKSSHTAASQLVELSYTVASQAMAIVVGLVAGLILGIILAAILRIARKDPMPKLPVSIQSPLATINFRGANNTDTTDA